MATNTGIICGIETVNKAKQYRVLLYKFENSNWTFSRAAVGEKELIEAIGHKRLALRNATIKKTAEGYKVVGTTGSLDRFEKDIKNGHRPVVILSEIKNLSDKILGYKVVKFDGTVSNTKIDPLLAYCARSVKAGLTPVQNAMFIPSDGATSAHIRGYVENQFIEEKMNIGHRETKEANVDKAQNKKNISKIEEIFTKEQIKELLLGKEHKVNYKLYGNPAFTAEQMKQLRKSLENHINPTRWADPSFSAESMQAYSVETKYGVDVSTFIHPKYDKAQIIELSSGLLSGVDISKMGDYTVSADEMSRRRIELEAELWKDIQVSVISMIEEFSRRENNPDRIKTANEKLEEKRKKIVAAKVSKKKAKKA